jgi:hypothetical protein
MVSVPILYSILFFSLYVQASLLLSLNLFSMLFLFPAMMALDVRRLFAARFDIFCCFGRDSSATNAAIIHNAKNEKVSSTKYYLYRICIFSRVVDPDPDSMTLWIRIHGQEK